MIDDDTTKYVCIRIAVRMKRHTIDNKQSRENKIAKQCTQFIGKSS